MNENNMTCHPWDETKRLAALAQYDILDTSPEKSFDDIVKMAAVLLDAPIAAINIIDAKRQWFKSEIGLGVREMPLDNSICLNAILQPGGLIVPDTTKDKRFACNPLITDEPGLRFYAGELLESKEGLPLGTLCVLDLKPRPAGLTEMQQFVLKTLAQQVMTQLELRCALKERDAMLAVRERTEAELRESEELVRTIAENSTQGLAMMDERGYCTYANRAWLEMTGYTIEEIRAKPLHDLVHHHYPDGRLYPKEECPIDRALPENFDVRAHEDLFFRKDGSTFRVSCAASPIFKADRPVATVVEIRDVTETKEIEQKLRESNQRKDDFLAMLAHELRNPLAPIRNAVSILRKLGAAQPQLANAQDVIDRQVRHMTSLIDDLLDVARISRGLIELRKASCNFVRIVQHAVSDYQTGFEASGVTLILECPDEPVWIEGDITRLTQIIGNLLHNAAKFTRAGDSVRVQLRIEGTAAKAQAVLELADTGIGIKPDLLESLFNPFIQAQQGLARSKGGLGLGLALVKGFAELHGGTVRVQSAGIGMGATFTLRFPLMTGEVVTELPVPCATGSERALRIVIVDDNQDMVATLQEILSLKGHQVDTAYDGLTAIHIARTIQPDVLICDIGLPGEKDGFRVAQTLRADPELNSTYLIALSGYGQESDRRRSHESGFDLHLVKPVSMEELEKALLSVPGS